MTALHLTIIILTVLLASCTMQRAFWQSLLHYNVSFHQLSTVIKRLDKAVHVAERVYRSVLQKNSTSVKLLRIYAKFLEHVKLGE
jgi:hypothetical protein